MSTQRQTRSSAGSSASLRVEIHGVDGPQDFDVLSGLAYVHSYLELLSAVARTKKESVNFTGLRIEKGSVAFAIDVDEPVLARNAAKESNEMLRGRRLPPQGLRTRVKNVREALSRMPAGNVAHVKVHNYAASLTVPDPDQGPRYESLEMRVTVYRVGGTPPRISVISDVDGGFRLTLGRDLAASIAKHLYHEIDIVALIARNVDGQIVGGKVLEFFSLDDASGKDEAEVWRAWFGEAGSDWDDVEDIEVELDRYRVGSLGG